MKKRCTICEHSEGKYSSNPLLKLQKCAKSEYPVENSRAQICNNFMQNEKDSDIITNNTQN